MLYFCISSIKTNLLCQKEHFFTDQWQLVKSSRKFSAILEFFLGPTFPCSLTFLCPALTPSLVPQAYVLMRGSKKSKCGHVGQRLCPMGGIPGSSEVWHIFLHSNANLKSLFNFVYLVVTNLRMVYYLWNKPTVWNGIIEWNICPPPNYSTGPSWSLGPWYL